MGFWEPSKYHLFIGIIMMVVSTIVYLPYFLFKLVGKGVWYKRLHFTFVFHLWALISEPKVYLRNLKGIQKQAMEERKAITN